MDRTRRRPDNQLIQQQPVGSLELLQVREQLRRLESHPTHPAVLSGQDVGAQIPHHDEEDLREARPGPALPLAALRRPYTGSRLPGEHRLEHPTEGVPSPPPEYRPPRL